VTRGWIPQRAGLPSLNGVGTAAAVSPEREREGGAKGRRGLPLPVGESGSISGVRRKAEGQGEELG